MIIETRMTDVYDHEETNGPAAPFFEYAIISSWLDKDYLRLNRFWMDGSLPVAFETVVLLNNKFAKAKDFVQI